jgi:hypothetical protein
VYAWHLYLPLEQQFFTTDIYGLLPLKQNPFKTQLLFWDLCLRSGLFSFSNLGLRTTSHSVLWVLFSASVFVTRTAFSTTCFNGLDLKVAAKYFEMLVQTDRYIHERAHQVQWQISSSSSSSILFHKILISGFYHHAGLTILSRIWTPTARPA